MFISYKEEKNIKCHNESWLMTQIKYDFWGLKMFDDQF